MEVAATKAELIPARVREALRLLRRKLEERFPGRLVDMRLFGSYARGDFHEESDVDVLVLLEDLRWPEDDRVVRAAVDVEIELDFAVVLSPLVRTPEQYQELLDRELLVALDIERDGIAL